MTGTLSNETRYRSRPAERWTLDAREGQQVTITLTSDDFDSYLMLVRVISMDSDAALAHDDDSAGGLNAQITFTLPETGTYSAAATRTGSTPWWWGSTTTRAPGRTCRAPWMTPCWSGTRW